MSDEFESLFKDGGSSSSDSESDVPESTADMILRAVGMKSGFENKWISDENRHFFYDSNSRRLICRTSEGKLLQYLGSGRYIPIDDPTNPNDAPEEGESLGEPSLESDGNVCWVTVVPVDQLEVMGPSCSSSKRQKASEEATAGVPKFSLNEIVENTTLPDFKCFLEKWDLLSEESSVRHLVKLDRQLIQYIMRRFNPLRAKPRNALFKFSESLLKHPQKWRIVSVIQEGLLESGDCETTPLPVDDGVLRIVTSRPRDEEGAVIELDPESVAPCEITMSRIGNDFYISNASSIDAVFVDGMRDLREDSPYGPLRNGSVIGVPRKDARSQTTFGALLLIEIGTPEDLVARRTNPVHTGEVPVQSLEAIVT